jgi:hypothetical protein
MLDRLDEIEWAPFDPDATPKPSEPEPKAAPPPPARRPRQRHARNAKTFEGM